MIKLKFAKWMENQGSVPLHHITTQISATLIQKEGFVPKSFFLQFQQACELTGANCNDPQLVEIVSKHFTNEEFTRNRNVFFFTDEVKKGFISDYTDNAEFSPVSEALRSILEDIKEYYNESRPEIAMKASEEQQKLYGQKKVMLTVEVPENMIKRNQNQGEVELSAQQANQFLNTLKITVI